MKKDIASLVVVLGVLGGACTGPQGEPGEPCTVTDNGDGTGTLTCPDGSEVVLATTDGNVTEIDGSFVIQNSFDVDFFASVRSVKGDLIVRASGLSTVSLPELTAVEGSLVIEDNEDLTGLDAPNLGIVGADLIARDNRALVDLAGLAALSTVTRDVRIENNRELESIAFLSAVQSEGNDALDDVVVQGNDSLLTVNGLGGLVDLGGNLVIEDNGILSDLGALVDLETVDGDVRLIGNDSLTSCAGLNGLQEIGNDLELDNNDGMTSLNGLGALTTVGDDVVITNNRELASIDGLSALADVGGRLTVTNNDALPECDAQDLALDLGVDADISGNDPNC